MSASHDPSDLPPVPFTVIHRAPHEMEYLEQALSSGHTEGDGPMTRAATELLRSRLGAPAALLTGSGTHALELAAILLDLGPSDEVLVPSFTFSSTAAAIALRGATPVFVDIESSTLGIDPDAARRAVTSRTRAIFVVHYAGVAADMTALQRVADEHGLAIVEDNAHGLGASLGGKPLGTFGALAAQSFHATKNIQCGEGGALVINDESLHERAEIVREKGTDRSRFMRGAVDKYTWQDIGSSYLPSELQAAVLRSQLESFEEIQKLRWSAWSRYADELTSWCADHGARIVDGYPGAEHPAHMFALVLPTAEAQSALLQRLRAAGIIATFHYVPLDPSPAGRRLGRTPEPCEVSHDTFSRLVRLPLFADITDAQVDRVLEQVVAFDPATAA